MTGFPKDGCKIIIRPRNIWAFLMLCLVFLIKEGLQNMSNALFATIVRFYNTPFSPALLMTLCNTFWIFVTKQLWWSFNTPFIFFLVIYFVWTCLAVLQLSRKIDKRLNILHSLKVHTAFQKNNKPTHLITFLVVGKLYGNLCKERGLKKLPFDPFKQQFRKWFDSKLSSSCTFIHVAGRG